jgi:hypothetical protein
MRPSTFTNANARVITVPQLNAKSPSIRPRKPIVIKVNPIDLRGSFSGVTPKIFY